MLFDGWTISVVVILTFEENEMSSCVKGASYSVSFFVCVDMVLHGRAQLEVVVPSSMSPMAPLKFV